MTLLSWLRNFLALLFGGFCCTLCLFVTMRNQMFVCDWTWRWNTYAVHLCVCCKNPSMKYSKSIENWSADLKSVSLPLHPPSSPPLSDQIPMELHPRRTVISHISGMTKFRAGTTAAAHSASAQINGILLSGGWECTMDHTHTLIRPSDWISHGRLDH